jgi:serine/threonine protein phosphatase PrpC
VAYFENYIIAAIADGCNWGIEPRIAAMKASEIFVEFMKSSIHECLDTHHISYFMMRALQAAHDSIVQGRHKDTLFQAGTTTILGCTVLPLDKPVKDCNWAFVCLNLGDCKAYHLDIKTNQISDITEGNRLDIYDAKDPGGRLGPQLDDGSPDLRNLALHSKLCSDGDIIILVSDGVHDNFGKKKTKKLDFSTFFFF